MGAALGNQNSAGVSEGKGGKSLNDRKLSAKVRTLALKELCKVLQNGRDDELFNPVLLKLAGTVLPRLNEHSGPDGEKIAAVMEINYLQPEIKEVKEIKKLSPAK